MPLRIFNNQLLALPIRYGGLGLLSQELIAPSAFAAAAESLERMLDPLFRIKPDADPPKLLSRKERCSLLYSSERDSLFQRLHEHKQKVGVEKRNFLKKELVEGSSLLCFWSLRNGKRL